MSDEFILTYAKQYDTNINTLLMQHFVFFSMKTRYLIPFFYLSLRNLLFLTLLVYYIIIYIILLLYKDLEYVLWRK